MKSISKTLLENIMPALTIALVLVLVVAVFVLLYKVSLAGGTQADRDMSKARKERAQRIAMAHARAQDEHAQYMATRSQRARDDYPFHNA